MKTLRTFSLLLLLYLILTGFLAKKDSFVFNETPEGMALFENGKPVFFYQGKSKISDGQYNCSNYLHPLWNIDGDTLTEEFPADHPYHRGVFWAWHQIYVDNRQVGDGWIMKDFEQKVTGIRSGIDNKCARLDVTVDWSSPLYQQGRKFVNEHTTISVHPLKKGMRIIDFTIRLRALVPEVSIGGSDDEKGYGGFCVRSKLPKNLVFTSTNGIVIPHTMQIEAGSWMDFSGSFGRDGIISGFTILCHPGNPDYPAPWILRSETSMQNSVYPGRRRVILSPDKPLTLQYQMIIHRGDVHSLTFTSATCQYSLPQKNRH